MEFTFSEDVIKTFNAIKNVRYGDGKHFLIPVYHNGRIVAALRPLTKSDLIDNESNRELIRLLSAWREANNVWYPSIFKVTEEGTKKWLKERVIDEPDRLLFMVETPEGVPFGHMGFYRGEADNFIRGRNDLVKGGMTYALNAMLEWASSDLSLSEITLRVFNDNSKAIAYYRRCGFNDAGRIPMRKVVVNGSIRWEEMDVDDGHAERYFLVMRRSLK